MSVDSFRAQDSLDKIPTEERKLRELKHTYVVR